MKDNVVHPGWVSIGLLLATLLVAGSEWGTLAELQSWGQMLEPTMMFSFLKSLGPVLVAWFAKAPVKST